MSDTEQTDESSSESTDSPERGLLQRFSGYLTQSPVGQWAQKSDLRIVITTIGLMYLLFAVLIVLEEGLSLASINPIVGAWRTLTFLFAAYGILALALNLQWGYTGMFNIGVAGFMGVGVYTMVLISGQTEGLTAGQGHGLGLPLPVGILLGMTVAALIGLVAALPALRLEADYLAIVTLGLSEIIRLMLQSRTVSVWLQRQSRRFFAGLGFVPFGDLPSGFATGGGRGITLPDRPTTILWELPVGDPILTVLTGEWLVSLLGLDVSGGRLVSESIAKDFVWAAVLLLVMSLIYIVLRRIGYSPFGRVLKAIREDELVAQSLGKDTRWFKIKVFMLGCALMGLAGILWQGSQGSVTPGSFRPTTTFYVFIAVIIGGAGSNTGSVIGAIVFVTLLRRLPPQIGAILQARLELGSAPTTFQNALGALSSGDIGKFTAYGLENLGPLQFVLVGVVLIVLIQRRPEGLLGHRSEIASPISLDRGEHNE